MSHEHEWMPFNVITSWTIQYKEVYICKLCRTFKVVDADGTAEIKT
jgi:hypothetical protein